jgi:cell division protein FtsQ
MTQEQQSARSAGSRRRRPRRTRRNSGAVGKLLITLAVAAAIIFGVAIFFKVNNIEVQGNAIYSSDQIVKASGLAVGDNLLTVNKQAAAGGITAALPYIKSVSIGRTLPDTVVISVVESKAAFAVKTDTNTLWLIDSTGKALEKTDDETAAAGAQIAGVSVESPTAGKLVTSSATPANLTAALSVLKALDGSGLLEQVKAIDVTKDYAITLWYGDQYEVLLGGTDQLDYKIQYLTVILGKLSNYQQGTIDLTLSESKTATFRPKT